MSLVCIYYSETEEATECRAGDTDAVIHAPGDVLMGSACENRDMTKPFRTVFILKWATYPYDTMIAVNVSRDQLIKRASKLLAKTKKGRAGLKELIDDKDITARSEDSKGLFNWYEESGRSVLWLKGWDGGWTDIDTLAHELHHAVYFWAKHICVEEEPEAQAYQFEFMFRTTREELNRQLNLHKKHSLNV